MIDGNSKLGKGVYTFSILAGNKTENVTIDGQNFDVAGTCPCNCPGCYAQKNRYAFGTVKEANARKTVLARLYPDFVQRAIVAQIKADKVKTCRIHASGDFFSTDYIALWRNVIKACPDCTFWTYTKLAEAESAFDDLANANVVKSIIPGIGYNFGHCDYIIDTFNKLQEMGKSVYICRCGIDKNQHCTNCKGCSKNDFVIFVEHSTGYIAESDPLYKDIVKLVESQKQF